MRFDFKAEAQHPDRFFHAILPIDGGYTVVNRMRQGKKVVVHGDGASLWVLTHHTDFAKGFDLIKSGQCGKVVLFP